MEQIQMNGIGAVEKVSKGFYSSLKNSYFDYDKSTSFIRGSAQSCAVLFVYDKFFLRTNTKSTLTIMFTQHGNNVVVDAVSTGGGSGILGFTFGADKKLLKIVPKILSQQGFQIVE